MMVLDASAVVEWLMGSERGDAVVAQMLDDPDGSFFAPDLLDVEVVQAFRRLARSGAVSDARATGAVELLDALPVERHSAGILVSRMWTLRDNLSAYAAAYVALAEALDCPLLTCDARSADAPGHRAKVRVVR
ncbi:MAG: type II toxin-antitoxin system VapC family toxin [Gemmatimonadetes bacterium]|nr:type II toxin-antitoxin system VapC family toxin [Gemmatimonadota bacterium]